MLVMFADTESGGYGVARARAFVSSLNQSEFVKFEALIVCVGGYLKYTIASAYRYTFVYLMSIV